MKQPDANWSSPVVKIKLDTIARSPFQVREDNDEDLDALAADMAANGLVQPVTVRHKLQLRTDKDNGVSSYELVAGHRRCAAARKLGWQNIQAIVVEADDNQAEAMLVAENFARRDLTPLEMADTAGALVERHGAAEAGRICGKSERWAQRMAYISGRLSEDWRRVARRWKLSQASLQAICKGSAEAQAQMLAEIIDDTPCKTVDEFLWLNDPPPVFENGGIPDELDGAICDSVALIEKLPWQMCGCVDCDGCLNRTDAVPELMFDEGEKRPRPGCMLRKCREKKMKEWCAGRGIEEWSRKLGMEVVPLPKGVNYWGGSSTPSDYFHVPVFLGEKSWPEGCVQWFSEEALDPKKKRKAKEEIWPTEKEVRDRAYAETARKWFKEGKGETTLANLARIAVAVVTAADIGGKREYALDRRLKLARDLSAQEAETTLRTGLIGRFVGANEDTRKQWEALIAVAIRDKAALSAMEEEAAALADRRIADIAERKKQMRKGQKGPAR